MPRGRLRTQYAYSGLALGLGGTAIALASWLIVGYIPLAALGVSVIILGMVSLGLALSLPSVSIYAGEVLLQAGLDNVLALVEELGARSHAIYVPAALAGGAPRALLALNGGAKGSSVSSIAVGKLERRLIVRTGQGPEDFGVLVATPGSAVLAALPGWVQSPPEDLEVALRSAIGALDLAGGVGARWEGNRIIVRVEDPAIGTLRHPTHDLIGSLVGSLAATVVAEVLGSPVVIVSESDEGRRHTVTLEPVDWGTK